MWSQTDTFPHVAQLEKEGNVNKQTPSSSSSSSFSSPSTYPSKIEAIERQNQMLVKKVHQLEENQIESTKALLKIVNVLDKEGLFAAFQSNADSESDCDEDEEDYCDMKVCDVTGCLNSFPYSWNRLFCEDHNKKRYDPSIQSVSNDEFKEDYESFHEEDYDYESHKRKRYVSEKDHSKSYKGPPYSCADCGLQFRRKGEFTAHLSSKGHRPKEYLCEYCDYKTDRYEQLASHFKSQRHKINKKNSQRKCSKTLKPPSDAFNEYFCEDCDYRTDRKASLLIHFTSQKHVNNQKKITLPSFSEEFPSLH